jgi:hypothetical protein
VLRSAQVRDDILSKADFWRLLWTSGETAATNAAATETMALICLHVPNGRGQTEAAAVFMAAATYVQSGDRARLEQSLLAALPDEDQQTIAETDDVS